MGDLVRFLNLVHWMTALLLVSLAVYSWKLRKKKTALALAHFFFLLGYWALFAALISNSSDLTTKIFLNRMKLLAPPLIPLSILYLACHLNDERKLPKWLWLALSLVPITTCLISVSPWYEFHVGAYEILSFHGHELLKFANGPWFRIHNFQTRVTTVLGLFLLVINNQKINPHHRLRSWLTLVAIVIPLLADTLSLWLYENLRFLQITPALSLFTALIMVYAVLKHHILDIVPFARAQILDSTNDAYVVFDESHRLVDYNGLASRHLGLDHDKIGIAADRLATPLGLLSALISDGRVSEVKLGRQDYEVMAKPLLGSRQQKIGTILHVRDISSQKQVEEELESIGRMKTNLLAMMSHDILGNLSAVLVMIENLRREARKEADGDRLATLENMHFCASNCSLFIDELLLWSKSQMGVMKPCYKEIHVQRVADEVLRFMQHDLINKSIEVTVDLSISQSIVSDPNMLLAILRNLLSNAVKFTPERGRIWLTFRESEADILVSVEDSGQGIAQERRDDMFQRDRKKGGGLGLIFCFEFVTFLGGKIWTESQPHRGAQFHFSLPKQQLIHP